MMKDQKLLLVLVAVFIASIITAELIGVKLFSLEKSLGFPEANMTILGENGLGFTLSVGVLPWPVIFILTDIINEYYGFRVVRFISFLSAFIIVAIFILLYISIALVPSEFWVGAFKYEGVPNAQRAFAVIMGQGNNIIIGSVTAFILGQLVDALIFRKMRLKWGDNNIWLRATLSTLVSQFIDSFVVTYIAFWLALGMPFTRVTSWALTAYMYKFVVAILFIPMLYVVRNLIDNYLGTRLSQSMKSRALRGANE